MGVTACLKRGLLAQVSTPTGRYQLPLLPRRTNVHP